MKKGIFLTVSILAIGFLLYLNFFSGKEPERARVIFTDKAPKPIGPYSQGIITGNTLFVAGQVGIDPSTSQLDTSSIGSETKQVMANIGAILEAAKMSYSNIVKTTIYLTDLKQFKTVNEAYGTCFKENPPARETVQVAALPKGAHIEISVIAVK